MPKGIYINVLRKAVDQYRYEISAELGVGGGAPVNPGEVRNSNADPSSPMASRTGRVVSKKDLAVES